MKRSCILLISVSIAVLAGCGSQAQYTPQQVVDKMHQQMVERASAQVKKMENPLVSTNEVKVQLKTKPIANLFPGSIDALFTGKQAADLRDAKKPLFSATMALQLDASAPGELFGMPTTAMQKAGFTFAGSARSLERMVFANISELSVRQPGKQPVAMDQELSTTWYKATFEELDKMLADAMQGDPSSPIGDAMTIDTLLQHSIGQYRDSAKQTIAIFEKLHVWNAKELLPEENGMYRVRVEAENKKVADAFEAFMDLVQQQNDPTGTNTELREVLAEQRKQMRADIEKSGKLSGVLHIDKASFEPRGFVGEFTDNAGTKLLTIDMLAMPNGDMHLSLINPANTKENVRFEKKGEAFSLTVEGKVLAEGTMSAKKFKATVYQLDGLTEGDTAPTLLTADIDILKITEQELDITGTITVPAGGSEITIKKGKIAFANAFKDVSVDMDIRATLLGSPAIELSATSVRKEAASVTVEQPTVAKPFSDFTQDFAPLMQRILQTEE